MVKFFGIITLSAFLFSTNSAAQDNGIVCDGKPCSDVAEEVFLTPTSPRKVIHRTLSDSDVKIPLFSDMTGISSAITNGKNSFFNVYHYGEKQAINIGFSDADGGFDAPEDAKVFKFTKQGITAYFYEDQHGIGYAQGSFFEAIIPITYGKKNRYIRYFTRGISEDDFKTLISNIEFNEN